MPSIFAWKVLGTYIVTAHVITRKFIQAVGKKLEADLADLKSRLKMQEMETRKANAKFVSSIATQEKLKTEFDAERKAWAEEKAALVTRAEQAEKALSEKTAELSGLKRQVSQMVAAIFGKSSHRLSSMSECLYLNIHPCRRFI